MPDRSPVPIATCDQPRLSPTRALDRRPYLFVALRWAKAKDVNLHGLDHLKHFAHRMHADAGVKAAMHAEDI